MATLSKPIEQIDQESQVAPAYQLRDTDLVIITLTDAQGNTTGQSYLFAVAAIRAALAPADVFATVAPAAGTPGTLNQRYYHSRAVVSGKPTRADLYVFNGTTWGLPALEGIVLDSTQPGGPLVGLALSATTVAPNTQVVLTATPSSTTSTPVKVEFFVQGTSVGTSTAAPWQFQYTPPAPGTYTVTAVVTDAQGRTASSQTQQLVVNPAQLPTPLIEFPAISDKTVGDSAFTITANSNNSVTPITFSTSDATHIGIATASNPGQATVGTVGVATLTASQAAGNGYGPATASIQVRVVAAPTTVPGAPIIGPTTAGNNQATTTASAPASNGGSPITGYKIYQVGTVAAIGTSTTLSYVDTTAVNGTAVQYQWSAVNSKGEGPKSDPSAAVTPAPPVAPTYPTVLSVAVPSDPAGECTIAIGDNYPDLTFQFTANAGGNATAKRMTAFIGTTFAFVLDFPQTYTDTQTPFRVDTGGRIYLGNFIDGTVTLTQFN